MRGPKPKNIVAATRMVDVVPNAPTWLSRAGRAEWKHVAPILVERRHLTDADLGALSAYACAFGEMVDATKTINREGMIVMTPMGPRKHPALSVLANARNQVRQLAAELGLTPVSRSRPDVRPDKSTDEDSPLGM